MDNAIYADPDKLDALSDELSKTQVMLENVFRENAEMIERTKHRLGRTLDTLARNLAVARDQLAQAEAALQQAQVDALDDEYDMVDLSFYMRMVYDAQSRVSLMEGASQSIKKLEAEYEAAAEHYKREEAECFQDYSNLLTKGESIVDKYSALVRASASAISGEPDGPSARDRIIAEGARGILSSPSPVAKVAAALLRSPPGTEDAVSRLLQAGWNAGIVASQEFMAATIRQHGPGPASTLQNIKIQKALHDAANSEEEGVNEE
jgi:hypothetical protein